MFKTGSFGKRSTHMFKCCAWHAKEPATKHTSLTPVQQETLLSTRNMEKVALNKKNCLNRSSALKLSERRIWPPASPSAVQSPRPRLQPRKPALSWPRTLRAASSSPGFCPRSAAGPRRAGPCAQSAPAGRCGPGRRAPSSC